MSDEETAHLAGKLEANLTASLMEMQWKNTMATYCTDDPDLCEKMVDFVLENSIYIGDEENASDPLRWSNDPDRWYQVRRRPNRIIGLFLHSCCCCCCTVVIVLLLLLLHCCCCCVVVVVVVVAATQCRTNT